MAGVSKLVGLKAHIGREANVRGRYSCIVVEEPCCKNLTVNIIMLIMRDDGEMMMRLDGSIQRCDAESAVVSYYCLLQRVVCVVVHVKIQGIEPHYSRLLYHYDDFFPSLSVLLVRSSLSLSL